MNILFSAAGRRVTLIRQFRSAMNNLGLQGKIIAADTVKTAPAAYVADHRVIIPRASDPHYIEALANICSDFSVGLLTSLIDTDLLLLSQHREVFSHAGARLLLSSAATNEICGDKKKTYTFFTEHGIATPRSYTLEEALKLPCGAFPLLIKPAEGSSGIGVTKVESHDTLRFFYPRIKNAMIQDFIEGDEYTIDVYVDFQGVTRCAVPRRRLEIRGGEVSKAITVKDPSIMAAACRVVDALPGALGCVTVQCFKQADGQILFNEINPRFGGGFPLSVHAGADFPKWILQELTTGNSEAQMSSWQDALVMLRYDDEIIVSGEDIK